MCDPATAAVAALSTVGRVAEINAQNTAAVNNANQAKAAMNTEAEGTQRGFIEQSRSIIQEGFDRVLQGRSAESEAYTSAIQSGVQGNSVRAVLRDRRMQSKRNQDRSRQELSSLKTQTGANLDHITSKAKGRIASVPTTSFGLGDAAGILTPIARSQME